MPKNYKVVEVQPAFVIHCSDVERIELFYIHVYEGPPSSPSFKVFDENDKQIEGVGLINLQFSDVSEHYRVVMTTPNGPRELNIIGIQPWLASQNSNGKNSTS